MRVKATWLNDEVSVISCRGCQRSAGEFRDRGSAVDGYRVSGSNEI